jgi:hypothetical protein
MQIARIKNDVRARTGREAISSIQSPQNERRLKNFFRIFEDFIFLNQIFNKRTNVCINCYVKASQVRRKARQGLPNETE